MPRRLRNAPGVRVGGILGTAIRTAVVGGLALYAFNRSRAYSDPKRFSEPALGRSRLVEIAASLRDFRVGDTSPEFTPYRELTDTQLASVYETIERERAPQRFDALVVEVRRRVQSTA